MLLAMLTACSGSPGITYHTLGANLNTPQTVVTPSRQIPSLGVGPVRLPALLDRQGVVLRKDQYSAEVSILHEWGGELEDEFLRALTQRLQQYLPNTDMRRVPWELEQTPKYQVSVHVDQFDGIPGQAAWLKGRWQLQWAANGRGIRAGNFDLQESVTGDSVEALVRTQSQLVDRLAVDISGGI